MDPASSSPADPQREVIPPPGQVNMVGIRLGYALGGLAWLTCFLVASRIGPDTGTGAASTIWINILICLFGSIAGWWLGFLMSPDPTEQGQFSNVRKAVSAFLSGFLLAKIDILFQDAVAQNLTSSPLFMGRLGLFVTTALICAQFTYVARHDLGMYGVGQFARERAEPPANTGGSDVHVELSRAQFWLRVIGLALLLVGIGLFFYRSVLQNFDVTQNIAILLLAASVFAFLFSMTTVRERLFGAGNARSNARK